MMKYFVRTAVSVMVMAFCAVSAHALDKSYYAETSKLASGKWVKIAVKESGIYQITVDDIRNWVWAPTFRKFMCLATAARH